MTTKYGDFQPHAHPHAHTHGRVRRGLGIIVAGRADHHPELTEKPGGTLHECAICPAYIVLAPSTVMFCTVNPGMPIVCCVCGEMSAEVLRLALPDAEFTRQPVPDLAKAGMFN